MHVINSPCVESCCNLHFTHLVPLSLSLSLSLSPPPPKSKEWKLQTTVWGERAGEWKLQTTFFFRLYPSIYITMSIFMFSYCFSDYLFWKKGSVLSVLRSEFHGERENKEKPNSRRGRRGEEKKGREAPPIAPPSPAAAPGEAAANKATSRPDPRPAIKGRHVHLAEREGIRVVLHWRRVNNVEKQWHQEQTSPRPNHPLREICAQRIFGHSRQEHGAGDDCP